MVREESIGTFLEQLGSKAPTPGGGGAAALAGAYGVSLGLMVAALTEGKKKYAAFEPRLAVLKQKLETLRETFLSLADEDARAFAPLAAAYGLPKETPEQQAERDAVMERCLLDAAMTPLRIMETACEALSYMEELAENGSRLAVSDVGVGVQFLNTAVTGAVMNVTVNTRLMKNREKAAELNGFASRFMEDGTHKAYAVYEQVEQALA